MDAATSYFLTLKGMKSSPMCPATHTPLFCCVLEALGKGYGAFGQHCQSAWMPSWPISPMSTILNLDPWFAPGGYKHVHLHGCDALHPSTFSRPAQQSVTSLNALRRVVCSKLAAADAPLPIVTPRALGSLSLLLSLVHRVPPDFHPSLSHDSLLPCSSSLSPPPHVLLPHWEVSSTSGNMATSLRM